jgi:hypothetical protein
MSRSGSAASTSTSCSGSPGGGRAISDAGSVFVYGSLVGAAAAAPGARLARLAGLARGWGVAMDNRVDQPGYKYYTSPLPGAVRPAVHVAFLDLRAAETGVTVLGVMAPVTADELGRLDERERNYRRIRVDERLNTRDGGPVWAYIGTPAARARFAAGPTVIHADYLREVLAGFAAIGPEVLAAVGEELGPGSLPVRELVRHELPVPLATRGTDCGQNPAV